MDRRSFGKGVAALIALAAMPVAVVKAAETTPNIAIAISGDYVLVTPDMIHELGSQYVGDENRFRVYDIGARKYLDIAIKNGKSLLLVVRDKDFYKGPNRDYLRGGMSMATMAGRIEHYKDDGTIKVLKDRIRLK
jgi:hypothetical protein